jgi:hypothetical protein
MPSAPQPPVIEGPWNPGLQSQIPADLLPLATIYRPEYVRTTLREARELADLTGLPMEDLVAFRPERLVVHELLALVTADFTVEDGHKTEDLGINFRRMTDALLTRHIAPHMAEIIAAYDALGLQLHAAVSAELERGLHEDAAATLQRGFWDRLLGKRKTASSVDEGETTDVRAIRRWEAQANAATDPLIRAAATALARVATDLACNEYGSEDIGSLIEPYVQRGAGIEGFRCLPVQHKPVVMNTKGASAAGKSTLRPLQRALAARIGVSWQDFALISPDIFRKFLLDYSTLGPAYKYAGSFSGHELQIVDHKLDRTMARKAKRGAMSHLLIDRFRFDTFAPASDVAGSNLLTRFGSLVYLFFLITPPDATVERAWYRGLEVGRYKAVDDLLAHNIEAFSGVPEVFFTWALAADKKVHYEFLDNSVALGETPRTVAFGWNGEMHVLDVGGMLDIERYRKIHVEARTPREVYPGAAEMTPENNTQFLAQCIRRLPIVNFADRSSQRIWLRMEQGKPAWFDPAALALAITDPETRAGIAAIAPEALSGSSLPEATARILDTERMHTLGNWGHACEDVVENS